MKKPKTFQIEKDEDWDRYGKTIYNLVEYHGKVCKEIYYNFTENELRNLKTTLDNFFERK